MDDDDGTATYSTRTLRRNDDASPLERTHGAFDPDDTTSSKNRRMYVNASTIATTASAARQAKRRDAVSLLGAMARQRQTERALAASTTNALAHTNTAAHPSRCTAAQQLTVRSGAAPPQSVAAIMAQAARVEGFGGWRPDSLAEQEDMPLERGYPPRGHSAVVSYLHPNQSFFVACDHLPHVRAALQVLHLARTGPVVPGMPPRSHPLWTLLLPKLHETIYDIRLQRKATSAATPREPRRAPLSLVQLSQEVVRRVLIRQGWVAALAVAMSVTSGRHLAPRPISNDAGRQSGSPRRWPIWRPPEACLGGPTAAESVEVMSTLLRGMAHHQSASAGSLRTSPLPQDDEGGSQRSAAMCVDPGTWDSSLACAATLLAAKADAARTPDKANAQFLAHIVHLAVHRTPPSPLDRLVALNRTRGASSTSAEMPAIYAPWDVVLRLWTTTAAAEQQPLLRAARYRRPRSAHEADYMAATVEGSYAAQALLQVANGGGSLERVQRTVDALCDLNEAHMKDPAVWAAYVKACSVVMVRSMVRSAWCDGNAGSSAAGDWAHALEVLGRNALQHDVRATPAMYEAAIAVALCPDVAAGVPRTGPQVNDAPPEVQLIVPSTASGWRLALRYLKRAESEGIAPSQVMLALGSTAAALARTHFAHEETADFSDQRAGDDPLHAFNGSGTQHNASQGTTQDRPTSLLHDPLVAHTLRLAELRRWRAQQDGRLRPDKPVAQERMPIAPPARELQLAAAVLASFANNRAPLLKLANPLEMQALQMNSVDATPPTAADSASPDVEEIFF
jgi:hypothetical protein